MLGPAHLDVAQYARLWRHFWRPCRITTLVTFVVTWLLAAAFAVVLIHGREALLLVFSEAYGSSLGVAELSMADRRAATDAVFEMFQNVMTRIEFAAMLALLAGVTISGWLAIARFRFRWTCLHAGLLTALTALVSKAAFTAVSNSTAICSAAESAGTPIDDWHLNGVWVAVNIACLAVPLLVLLVWQLVPLVGIARHRLAYGWPRTWRMTQSLGENLDFDKVSRSSLSLPGGGLQAAVLAAIGFVVYQYPFKLVQAVLIGTLSLVTFSFQIIANFFISVGLLVHGENPASAFVMSWWAEFVEAMQQFAIVIAGAAVLIALWRLGQRLNRRRRDQQILATKPAVLLLRSFMDDDALIRPNSLLWRIVLRKKRLEECIGEELLSAGPFFAIGKPGESLPPLGAERVYLSDDTWQDAVLDFMLKAERIVMVAGKTHWVQWELNKVLEQRGMAKLVLVLPPERAEERAARWSNLRPPLEGTAWTSDLADIDAARVLAVVFGPTGATAITGGNVYESDYETALRVATYVMQNPH